MTWPTTQTTGQDESWQWGSKLLHNGNGTTLSRQVLNFLFIYFFVKEQGAGNVMFSRGAHSSVFVSGFDVSTPNWRSQLHPVQGDLEVMMWLGWFLRPPSLKLEQGKEENTQLYLFLWRVLLTAQLWASIIVAKHSHHELSVKMRPLNKLAWEMWEKLWLGCRSWLDGVRTQGCNCIFRLKIWLVFRLVLALQLLKTSQDHLGCNDGSFVHLKHSSSLTPAVLLSNAGI